METTEEILDFHFLSKLQDSAGKREQLVWDRWFKGARTQLSNKKYDEANFVIQHFFLVGLSRKHTESHAITFNAIF